MEKPVERTTDAATDLVEVAEAAKVELGIVFQQRFRDASLRAAEVVAGGGLGSLTSVRVEVPWWREQSYYDEPGRGTLARDGGGVLISQAIHSLDLMLALTRIVIAGTDGTACLAGAELHIHYRNGRTESLGSDTGSGGGADPMDFPHHWHQRLIEDFLDAVEQGRKPVVTGRGSLGVHQLIDALLDSSSRKCHVTLSANT